MKIEHGANAYAEVIAVVQEQASIYGNCLVTLRVDDRITTELLCFNGDYGGFCFENDWWEGEKEIELLGFVPICNLQIIGNVVDDITIRSRKAIDEPEMQVYPKLDGRGG